jgi:very-short-patch-repair endonuclease
LTDHVEVDLTRRARNLVEFLRRLVQMRTAIVRDIDAYEDRVWFDQVPELPGSHCVTHPGRSSDNEWIALERPRIPPRPRIPELLWGWLANDDDTAAEPELREPEEGEEMADSVIGAYGSYLDEWRAWNAEYGPRVPLLALYEHLFRMKQQADQLGERYEVVVGAGLALIPDGDHGRVRRHIVVMRVEIEYHAQTGRMAVKPAPDGLHVQLEDEMLDPALVPTKELRDSVIGNLEEAGTDLWANGALREAISIWAQAMRHDARFDDGCAVPTMPSTGVLVALAPALILRRRTSRSLLAFYQNVDDLLDAGAPVPELVAGLIAVPDGHVADVAPPIPWADDELYFPKPSNAQQRDVLRRLVSTDGVVVVGPPGTGKSHTIANLVSHLLAHGQRVLVTSHTSRALEVLLDKLPPEVRSLSVSLVGDGRAGMHELKRSVGAIVNRSTDPEWQGAQIEQRIERLKKLRERAHEERRRHLAAIREMREGDAREHATGLSDYRGTLSVIAERVAEERDRFGWASDMIGNSPVLTNAEANGLASLAVAITPAMEATTRVPLPELPESEVFADLCRRYAELDEAAESAAISRTLPYAPTLASATHADRQGLAVAIDALERGRHAVAMEESWELAAFEGVLSGRSADWREHAARTSDWVSSLGNAAPVADGLVVTGALAADPVAARTAIDGVLEHLRAGGSRGFGPFRPSVIKDARAAAGTVRIDGRAPETIPELEAFRAWVEFRVVRDKAAPAWATERRLDDATPRGLLANLEELEAAARRVLGAEELRREIVAAAGSIQLAPLPSWPDSAGWTTLRRAALAVDAEASLAAARAEVSALRATVETSVVGDAGDLVPLVLAAIDARDPKAFGLARASVMSRRQLASRVTRRDDMSRRLAQQASEPTLAQITDEPLWAGRLTEYEAAFWWSKAEGWLHEMLDASSGGAVSRVGVLGDEIRALTASIGEHLAWRACLVGLTKAQLQHLALYQQAMARYGLGKGKFAATHLANAQKELEACRAAVPAWIMPTYRVAESLSPTAEPFDVVIVDEASQSGIDALFLWWLGKKVLIVGDDQQISPDAVGVELGPVIAIRDQLLGDQPIGRVIMPATSLFDLGGIAFPGNQTYLKEHFRCMPEIIAFSNRISYSDAPLEPLRQFGSDRLPPLQSRHVAGATKTDGIRKNVNRDEAHALAEAIVECIAKPEYDGKTVGVISLTGADQARYIENLLLKDLGPDEILRRRIKCGDAYAFQGDERDVMFLSMVATPTEKGNRLPALGGDVYRRRFNVSASRARDQMWLFHSVTQADLNPDCFRSKLLEHFLHPTEHGEDPELGPVSVRDRHPAFESLFEQRVYLQIKNKGYRVRPQVPTYGYRLDLVVIGGDSRLAVECDGDEWHGAEQYEADLARQQDLERVGWRFVRIRESEFYLDPKEALRPLWSKLQEIGIRAFGEARPEASVEVDSTETEAVVRALLDPFAISGALTIQDAGNGSPVVPLQAPPPLGSTQNIIDYPQIPGSDASITPEPAPVDPGTSDRGDLSRIGQEVSSRPPRPGRVQMAPYVGWKARPLADPREARQSELIAVLLEIVGVEGPVLARRAYRLMLQAAGFHRLVHTVVSPLNKAAVRAEREGRLIAAALGVGSSLADRVLRLPHQAAVAVRKRGPRGLEEVPASEIKEVARMLRADRVSPTDRDLKRGILAAYDRTSLTQAASAYLEQCLLAATPAGPAIRVDEPSVWERATPPRTAPRTVPAAPAPPVASVSNFPRVLADTIAKAQALSTGARARLTAEWLDDEREVERRKVVEAARGGGAPREWSVVARVVSAQLGDWSASARGAVVDAAYAQGAVGVPAYADALLRPWRSALQPGKPDGEVSPGADTRERCPHGKLMGTCALITCKGHALGGMGLDEN